jgi:3-hydroxybutyryl-CoA dehydrogenase
MKLVILANDQQKHELTTKKIKENVQLNYVESLLEVSAYYDADCIIVLDDTIAPESLSDIKTGVLINSVSSTLETYKNNLVTRINGWNTFIKNDVWEIATNDEERMKKIFNALGWQYIIVADEPGFVSARILSMIVNEAYFALGDEVSTKAEIDLAMKLGTNYPMGPFEWSEKIGLKNIYSLLTKLKDQGKRYEIAPALENEISRSNP